MTTPSLRLPSDEYTGPPKAWFLDEAWYVRDLETLFRSRWLLAGHVDQLQSSAGEYAYLTFSLGLEEVLIRKDEHGEIRAYHNVCSHRGSRLCSDRMGTTKSQRIVCPYHAWTYSVADGRLVTASAMHEDFDASVVHLKPVHAEVWKGLIFVCLADEPVPTIADHLGRLSFAGYDFDAMKLAAVKTHEIRANWKIVVENNLECYHCPMIHPELSAVQDWTSTASTSDGFDAALASRANGLEVFEASRATPNTINGERVCAIASPRLDADLDPPASVSFWETGVLLIISRDYGWMFVPKPVASDRTELTQYWFVARTADEGRDFDRDRLMRFFDTTMLQDRDVCESVQRGMRMPAYTPGPLNRIHQSGQAAFYAWYVEQIRARFPELVDTPSPAAARHSTITQVAPAGAVAV